MDLNKVPRKLSIGDICKVDCYGDIAGYFIVDGVCFRPEFDEEAEEGFRVDVTYEMIGVGYDNQSVLEYIFDEDVVLVAKREDALDFVKKLFTKNNPNIFPTEEKLNQFIESFVLGEAEKEVSKMPIDEREDEEVSDEFEFEYEVSHDGLLDAMNDQDFCLKYLGYESEGIGIQIKVLREVLGVK